MAEPLPQKPVTTPIIPSLSVNTVSRAGSPLIPVRRPPALPAQVTASPVLQPLAKAAGPSRPPSEAPRIPLPTAADRRATSANYASVSIQPSPKNETARIAIVPKLPETADRSQSKPGIVLTSTAIGAFDSIPRQFCWGLLGISTLIFLIQIWNYALS
jgi:hypothetical protein